MGEADAQNEAVAGGGLHGEGLLGQHHGMARVDRDHAGAQADTGDLRPGGGQQGQCVVPEDLDGEGMVESGVGEALSWATVSGSDWSTSIRLPMRRGLAMVCGLLA